MIHMNVSHVIYLYKIMKYFCNYNLEYVYIHLLDSYFMAFVVCD